MGDDMRKLLLVLLGLLPLPIGMMISSWILANPDRVIPGRTLIGVAFLIFWVLIGYLTSKVEKKSANAAIFAHLPAFLMLIIHQMRTLPNLLGSNLDLMAQYFFMPFIGVSSFLTGWFFRLTGMPVSLGIYSVVSFLLMAIAYYLGSLLRIRRDI